MGAKTGTGLGGVLIDDNEVVVVGRGTLRVISSNQRRSSTLPLSLGLLMRQRVQCSAVYKKGRLRPERGTRLFLLRLLFG